MQIIVFGISCYVEISLLSGNFPVIQVAHLWYYPVKFSRLLYLTFMYVFMVYNKIVLILRNS